MRRTSDGDKYLLEKPVKCRLIRITQLNALATLFFTPMMCHNNNILMTYQFLLSSYKATCPILYAFNKRRRKWCTLRVGVANEHLVLSKLNKLSVGANIIYLVSLKQIVNTYAPVTLELRLPATMSVVRPTLVVVRNIAFFLRLQPSGHTIIPVSDLS